MSEPTHPAQDPRDLTQTIADVAPGATPATGAIGNNDRPVLPRAGVAGDLAPGSPRYHFGERRGSGATGSVYIAYDADLARMVAVKVLDRPQRTERFTREARILAGLEHPHIAPLYDFDQTSEGHLCFTMRLVEGQSLGDAISAMKAGEEPVVPITGVMERVVIIRKICDALLYAHHHDVLHQDVKPDNILLGKFGEVLLVDWGAASAKSEAGEGSGRRRLVGTPAYLAPEVARGEAASVASDVYALGATLFQLLTWRYPLWDEDPERFWRRRRAGEIDDLTSAERERLPAPLIAIVFRALEANPAARYGDIQAFADDLDAFQAGLAVSAYRDPLAVRLVRWHRHHLRAVWSTVAIASVIITAALILYGERLKRIATWGQPIAIETFSDDVHWRQSWKCVYGTFEIRDGRMVSTAALASDIYFNRRCEGDTAIEYTGMLQPGEAPCDISVNYAVSDPFDTKHEVRRYMLQIGARDNSYAQILDPAGNLLAFSPLTLQIGRPYRIRVEIEGETLRIILDGSTICEYRELLPLPSGWVGLYAWYPGKSFDDINIYSKGMPQQVSVLAIGDQYCQDQEWDRAAAFYQRVATTYAGQPLGSEARYWQGFALRKAGHSAEAATAWDSLPPGRWNERVHLHTLEDRLIERDYQAVATGIREYYLRADDDLRQHYESLWSAAVLGTVIVDGYDPPTVEALFAVQRSLFPKKRREIYASALLGIRQPQAVLAHFADQGPSACTALHLLGRDDEIPTAYPALRYHVGMAYIYTGQFDALAAMDPPMPYLRQQGEAFRTIDLENLDIAAQNATIDQAVNDFDTYLAAANLVDRAAIAVDRLEAQLKPNQRPHPTTSVITTYFFAERVDILRQRYPLSPIIPALAAYHDGIADFRAGKPVTTVITDPGIAWYDSKELWISKLLLEPMIAHIAGDEQAMPRALADLATIHRWQFLQQPWYAGEYLSGRIDEAAFLAQPCVANSDQILAVCRGLRCELQGDHLGALTAYRDFLERPPHQRALLGWLRDPIAEVFIHWRVEALAAQHP